MPMKRTRVTPAVPQLAFSMLVPEDFRQLPLPAEPTDFSDPNIMMPLAVFMAGYGAVLASVAARPLNPDGSEGSLMDIAMRLAHAQLATAGGKVTTLMPGRKWGTMVVEAEATQPSEAGEMKFRAFFVEDGGTLFNVAMMAPVALWPAVEKTLIEMVESFSLLAQQGPTRPIAPGQPLPPKPVFSDTGTPAPAKSEDKPAGGPPDLSPFALDDARALDPEEPINKRFRDAGAGLVPNVLAEGAQGVVVGLGGIEAALPIPRGWHAVDDGRRALIFDGGNNVQVNLTLLEIAGRSPADIFNETLDDLRKESPNLEHREFETGGFQAMHVRNLVIDGTALHQAYLLRQHPQKEHLALKIRVTATEENLPRAVDMAGAMMSGVRFM
jgi:hypothetical protein